MLLDVATDTGGQGDRMSTAVQVPERQIALAQLPIDQRRGWYAMWCVIATEFMLFVCMF